MDASQTHGRTQGLIFYSVSSNLIPVGGGIEFAGLKVEYGSRPTPFVPRSYAEELALCQRYFYRFKRTTTSGAGHLAQGITATSTIAYVYHYFPVPMRTHPSVTVSSDFSGVYLYDTSAKAGISSITKDVGGAESYGLKVVTSTEVLTPGNAVVLNCNSTPFYVDYSAEL